MLENKFGTKRHCDFLKGILLPLKSLCPSTKFQVVIYPTFQYVSYISLEKNELTELSKI